MRILYLIVFLFSYLSACESSSEDPPNVCKPSSSAYSAACVLRNFECSVCRSSFNIESCLVVCNCNHVFHEKCINDWNSNNLNCPECRQHTKRDFFLKPIKKSSCCLRLREININPDDLSYNRRSIHSQSDRMEIAESRSRRCCGFLRFLCFEDD